MSEISENRAHSHVAGAGGARHYAYVAHHIPGRARIRVPAGKRNPQLLRAVTDAVAKVPEIKRVEANPVTGGVLIHYEPSAFARFIGVLIEALEPILMLAAPEAEELTAAVGLISGPSQIAKGIADSFRFLDREVKVASANTVDLRALVPLTAATVALTMAAESMGTPLWLTLAIFSVNSFLQLNEI